MTAKELCKKYNVSCLEDIDPAWERYVTQVEDSDTSDYNAAMLNFLNRYFSIQKNKESRYFQDEERAASFIVDQMNALFAKDAKLIRVQKNGKSRNAATLAALKKTIWNLYLDCPVEIEITDNKDGTFRCELGYGIYCSEKAGEMTMKLLDNDRFVTRWLSILYAAMCENLNAYYRIGLTLRDSDPASVHSLVSEIYQFPFRGRTVWFQPWVKNAPSTCTLTPDEPVYWFHLGAEAGGTNCTYLAAKAFGDKKLYPLYAKYMLDLTSYSNDYRSEAEIAILELMVTQNIPESFLSKRAKDTLLSRLLDKYTPKIPAKLSAQALRLLADHAYDQKKYPAAITFYRNSGITTPEKAPNLALVERMGNMLYDTGETDGALSWLVWSYEHNPYYQIVGNFPNWGKDTTCDTNGVPYKIGKIYLDRWNKNHLPTDGNQVAKYLTMCKLPPKDMAQLLRMHMEKAITLDDARVQQYAQSGIHDLDAKTAGNLGYRLWSKQKTAEQELPVALMRRAIHQAPTNGSYWRCLGLMVGYNTLFGQGFSEERRKEAAGHFEKARQYGDLQAILYLSDCYWADNKDGFPQDFQQAKQLLEEYLKKGGAQAQYSAYSRLARISRLEKQPFDEIALQLAKAHEANPKGNAADNFQKWYGEWFRDYIALLGENSIQQEMEKLFFGYPDFLYALALRQELAGNYRCAITLYGCSAAMGSKKALCVLYSMATPGTNYFSAREVCI